MTKSKAKTPPSNDQPDNALKVPAKDGDDLRTATAKALMTPDFRHAMAVNQLHSKNLGKLDFYPGVGNFADAIGVNGDKAVNGELAFVSRLLAAQAMTLDNIFVEMTRRMAINMGEHLPATETYARIALKAQANSRATLEALTKLHQPREQTVRHVHVNEGGQAVIADQFHHHTGGTENGQSVEQPHATGTGSAGAVVALPSPDPLGNGVPIPCRQRKRPVPDARRQG